MLKPVATRETFLLDVTVITTLLILLAKWGPFREMGPGWLGLTTLKARLSVKARFYV